MKCLKRDDYEEGKFFCLHYIHVIHTNGRPAPICRKMWDEKHCYCKGGKNNYKKRKPCKFLHIEKNKEVMK